MIDALAILGRIGVQQPVVIFVPGVKSPVKANESLGTCHIIEYHDLVPLADCSSIHPRAWTTMLPAGPVIPEGTRSRSWLSPKLKNTELVTRCCTKNAVLASGDRDVTVSSSLQDDAAS